MMSRSIFSNTSPCHHGPVEVVTNFYCGSAEEALIMASEAIRVDTLIPLYCLDADIWKLGFRGEILYYPIDDFGILPDDVLNSLVTKILDRLSLNKKVGLFCMGGHGRTGYVASVVLGKLGFKDPIQLLRKTYCKEAVESGAQIRQIAKALGRPELTRKYTQKASALRDLYWDDCYSANILASLEEHGISCCQNCDAPVLYNGHGDIPERCSVCGEDIIWLK